MAELRHSELEDPFRDLSSLSLLRPTLAGVEPADLESHELESIQSVFESMATKGSTAQLVEQARTIMDSYTDLESVLSEDRDETVGPNGKNPAQERRPALGRKRAKFSLKPAPSHSFPTVDLRSSIDHIEDPVEYFSAVEQYEKADKELKKLTGKTSTDLLQHPTTTARKRRPGILGKTVSYKHQFSANDVSSEALVESQEELIDGRISRPLKALAYMELSNASHSKSTKQPGTLETNITDNKSQDTSGTGPEADKDKRTDNVLEKLLSSFEDLNGDEGETLLRESLQMKSIDVDKICLPDLGAIRRIDRNLDNDRVTRGQVKGSGISHTSPCRKKSPFAAIATLQRRASLISSHKNLYSVHPSDEPPRGDSLDRGLNGVPPSPLLTESRDKRGLAVRGVFSPVTKSGVEFSSVEKTHMPVAEADGIISGKITIDNELPVKTSHSSDRDAEHCSNCIAVDKDIISSGPDGCLQEEGSSIELDPSISNCPDLNRASINHARTEDLASELDGCLQEDNNIVLGLSVNDHPDVIGGPNSDSIHHTRIEDLASAHHRSMGEKCSNYGTNADASSGLADTSHAEANTTVGDQAVNVEAANDNSRSPKTTLAVDQDQDQDQGGLSTLRKRNDEGNKKVSGASPNRGRKVKAVAGRRESKSSILKRQSLADAGMLWKSGVRRSSRIRSRPLEYWRGERFLYGRIHDSLTTVIGVKCASPGNNELKVKSFVPDKYADLVAQAALH